jgi:3-hydroxyisobutyrate dehydrogenase-like beta-hydroxyacid dehydrogenase
MTRLADEQDDIWDPALTPTGADGTVLCFLSEAFMNDSVRVGFIGLGRMGQAMAARILAADHDLVVFNRTEEKVRELVKGGALPAGSIAEACQDREVVITMVTDDVALRDVTLGPKGVKASLPAGAIHLCMGTHGAGVIQQLANSHNEAKQTLVAAPVLGRPEAVTSGNLNIVAAGPEEALRKCEPLFKAMGKRTFHAGAKPEGAIAIKLSNNFVLGCAIEAMAESFSLIRKYGVAPQVFFEVMTEGLFAAPAYKTYGKIIVDESYEKVGFSTMTALKDSRLIFEAADLARVPLPSGSVWRDRLLSAAARGEGDLDWAVMAREQGRSSGLE